MSGSMKGSVAAAGYHPGSVIGTEEVKSLLSTQKRQRYKFLGAHRHLLGGASEVAHHHLLRLRDTSTMKVWNLDYSGDGFRWYANKIQQPKEELEDLEPEEHGAYSDMYSMFSVSGAMLLELMDRFGNHSKTYDPTNHNCHHFVRYFLDVVKNMGFDGVHVPDGKSQGKLAVVNDGAAKTEAFGLIFRHTAARPNHNHNNEQQQQNGGGVIGTIGDGDGGAAQRHRLNRKPQQHGGVGGDEDTSGGGAGGAGDDRHHHHRHHNHELEPNLHHKKKHHAGGGAPAGAGAAGHSVAHREHINHDGSVVVGEDDRARAKHPDHHHHHNNQQQHAGNRGSNRR